MLDEAPCSGRRCTYAQLNMYLCESRASTGTEEGLMSGRQKEVARPHRDAARNVALPHFTRMRRPYWRAFSFAAGAA